MTLTVVEASYVPVCLVHACLLLASSARLVGWALGVRSPVVHVLGRFKMR